jgi:histidinol phosphatase-like enzyme (inositol monophosphatase family)
VEWKADGSEVTVADREAEAAARDWIGQRFPGDAIVGEELGGTPAGAHARGVRRWYIDPIDGTKSFVRGVPLWGSMVAVELDGTVVAGAISCAATGDLVAAARGEGCWHNDARASVSDVDRIERATILGTSAAFRKNPERATRWNALASRVSIARTWGDCYGYVLVATGRAELMTDDRLSPWDVAALIPIITEAGGVFTGWGGRLEGLPSDGVASNAALATPFRQALGVPEPAAGRP